MLLPKTLWRTLAANAASRDTPTRASRRPKTLARAGRASCLLESTLDLLSPVPTLRALWRLVHAQPPLGTSRRQPRRTPQKGQPRCMISSATSCRTRQIRRTHLHAFMAPVMPSPLQSFSERCPGALLPSCIASILFGLGCLISSFGRVPTRSALVQ